MNKCFLDTNILVYLFDDSNKKKKNIAQELFAKNAEQGTICLSTQVLQEFYIVVTRKLKIPLSSKQAYGVVENLSKFPIVPIDTAMILTAIIRTQKIPLSFWDSLIIEAAIKSGSDILYTEDLNANQVIESITLINPFI